MSNFLNQNWFRWSCVIAWAGLIFFLSSISSLPGAGVNILDFFIKKSAHVLVYTVLYLLLIRALKPTNKSSLVGAYLIVVAYAVTDELHQAFVPGRTATIMDIGFDSLGASFGFVIAKWAPIRFTKFILK